MKHRWILLSVCLYGIMVFSGCGKEGHTASSSEKISTVNSQKLLLPAILLKTAAGIQDKYFLYVYPVHTKSSDQVKLYKFLNDYVLDKTSIRESGTAITFKEKKYQDCFNEIKCGDHNLWQVKHVLACFDIPDSYRSGNRLLFNPLIFLPGSRGMPGEVTNIYILWDWFYTAILIKDSKFLQEVSPVFLRLLEKNPEDLCVFKSLYKLSLNKGTTPGVDAPAAANYYLLAGNASPGLRLTKPEQQKLEKIKKKYDTSYLKQRHITVNAFTLENRIYMWLAARQAELDNDIHQAYVYLKTTFDNQVLADVKNFPPNHQVYLYTTIRIALEIRSPRMYRYVIGALNPLTKFNRTGNKEYLVTQLYQLID